MKTIFRTVMVMILTFIVYDVSAQQGMRLMSPLHETMSKLDELQLTGDPDHDFASIMQIHHKGGIDLAEEAINSGSDSEVINLAKKIRESQEKDIKELGKFATDHGDLVSNDAFLKEVYGNIEKSKSDMNEHMKLSGNPDQDFVSLMSMHHEHGIDMTKTLLKYGKNEDLKQLAQSMLENQESEKEELDRLKGTDGMGKMRHESTDSASTSHRH